LNGDMVYALLVTKYNTNVNSIPPSPIHSIGECGKS